MTTETKRCGMSKRMLTAILLMQFASTNAFATRSCLDLVKTCDAAIESQGKAIEIRDLRLKAQEDHIGRLTEERDNAEKRASAWYRNPWLWGAVGFGLGVYVMKR